MQLYLLMGLFNSSYYIAPTRVEFLFRVLFGIGMLFRVGTLYNRVSLRVTSCSCEGETQIWRYMFVNEPQVGMAFGDVQV